MRSGARSGIGVGGGRFFFLGVGPLVTHGDSGSDFESAGYRGVRTTFDIIDVRSFLHRDGCARHREYFRGHGCVLGKEAGAESNGHEQEREK